MRWKAFLSCGCRGLARVACSLFPSRRHSILEVVEDVLLRPLLLKFAALRAAVENQETKAQRAKELALAGPGIGLSAGRRAEPVTGEGKGFAQNRERGITWVIVSVEAEIGARCRRLLRKSGHNK